MSHSLNEIESLSKRAARGAGLSWGMSEEAGRAVRWLASHGLPGVDLMADVLGRYDLMRYDQLCPKSVDGIWEALSGTLCPFASGATLNDCADRLSTGQSIEISNVSHPLLVVPFAAWASVHIQAPVTVSWHNTCISTDGYGIWVDDPNGTMDQTGAVSLICSRAEPMNNRATAPAHRGSVSQTTWTRLGAFAHRTYAPATEQSRILGAGAGVSDYD